MGECIETHWSSVLLGDQEVGSSRPQAGDGVVWFPRRRLSITSPAAVRGRNSAAEAGLHVQRLAVMCVCLCVCVCVCVRERESVCVSLHFYLVHSSGPCEM